MLDTVYRIETPEGVDLDLRVAGPLARGLAWSVDFLLKILIGTAITIPLAVLGQFGLGMVLIVMFLLEWLYPILFEVLADGATPGKKALHLRVVHRDGTPVGLVASVLRNLLRAADFLPVLYGVGLLSTLFSGSFQRLGDLAAGTLVVYRDEHQAEAEVVRVSPVPPPVVLRLAEQRTLISFGQRAAWLSPARTRELAGIASPLLSAGDDRSIDPVTQLCGMAAWLIGRRAGDQAPESSGSARGGA